MVGLCSDLENLEMQRRIWTIQNHEVAAREVNGNVASKYPCGPLSNRGFRDYVAGKDGEGSP